MSALVFHTLVAHLAGDFLLQTDEMAAQKFDNWRVRAEHVTAYSAPFILVLAAADLPLLTTAVLYVYLWVSHFFIDTQRWAEPKPGFEAYPITVDQTLHLLALAPVVEVIA